MSKPDYEFPFFSTNMNDEEKEVYDEVCNLSTIKLFEEFDKTMDHEHIKNMTRYDVIRGVISDRLGLVHRNWFGPILAVELNELDGAVSNLENKIQEPQTRYIKKLLFKA